VYDRPTANLLEQRDLLRTEREADKAS
jgi:hypothetical protein